MAQAILWILNIGLVIFLFSLFTRKDLLSYFKGGRLWITWLATGVITLMDEFTSIFYAPSEAFRFIGLAAIIFIPFPAIFIRFLTTRMVEIAEILDFHHLKGGGVYNFSYFVLGPLISFVAVASIMVDYILTAAISTISAVENSGSFFTLGVPVKLALAVLAVWGIAGLNISGIRENARVTFAIFIATAIIFMNLIVSALFHFHMENVVVIQQGFHQSFAHLTSGGFFGGYSYMIAAISSCVLAYSGVESVLQSAGLVEDWRVIGKAYIFLALTVGIVTPLVTVLVLSQTNINFAEHETDLITHFATLLRGRIFGITVGALASVTLLMAVNTAFVASSELMERICHRYGFHWFIKTNKRASLYRIHIANALFYSIIILMTQGSQGTLADMYAVGLVASFLINLLALLIYHYSKGTKEVAPYNVSRLGTLLIFVVLGSCFLYLCYHKPHGFLLWIVVTIFSLIAGIYGTRKRAPELKEIEEGENPMDIIFYMAESEETNINIYFKRPFDTAQEKMYGLPLFVTFYSPRQKIPPRAGPNHFRIPFKRANIFNNIVATLSLVTYEISEKNITVHFGWPTSSWIDRLSTGVMVFQFMRFPKTFPGIHFKIEHFS